MRQLHMLKESLLYSINRVTSLLVAQTKNEHRPHQGTHIHGLQLLDTCCVIHTHLHTHIYTNKHTPHTRLLPGTFGKKSVICGGPRLDTNHLCGGYTTAGGVTHNAKCPRQLKAVDAAAVAASMTRRRQLPCSYQWALRLLLSALYGCITR
jgi:hypothetical protein